MNQNTRKTILLVDDEMLAALSAGTILEKHGYAVRTVTTAQAAVERALGAEAPDLIVLELESGSGSDGAAAAREILARRRIPIVIRYAPKEAARLASLTDLPLAGFAAKSAGETVLLRTVELAFRAWGAPSPAAAKAVAVKTAAAIPAPPATTTTAPFSAGDREFLLRIITRRSCAAIASIAAMLEAGAAPAGAALERARGLRLCLDQILADNAFRKISIKIYLDGLLSALLALYPQTVALEKRLDDFTCSSRRLFVMGLAVRELVVNALEHAFADRPGGRIAVRTSRAKGSVTVTVRDDGVGLPAGFDPDRADGDGWRFVRLLARLLDGEFVIDGRTGTSCSLVFPELD